MPLPSNSTRPRRSAPTPSFKSPAISSLICSPAFSRSSPPPPPKAAPRNALMPNRREPSSSAAGHATPQKPRAPSCHLRMRESLVEHLLQPAPNTVCLEVIEQSLVQIHHRRIRNVVLNELQ